MNSLFGEHDGGWTEKEGSYSRPLGPQEHTFYLDALQESQTDTFSSIILNPPTGFDSKDLLERIRWSWAEILKNNPLLGCSIVEGAGGKPLFDYKLPRDIDDLDRRIFKEELAEGNFQKGMNEFLSDTINGESQYVNYGIPTGCLAGLVVLTQQSSNKVGVIFVISHVVCDGQSLLRMLQVFLDNISSSSLPLSVSNLSEPELLKRLPLSTESLYPILPLPSSPTSTLPNIHRKRWFWAVRSILRSLAAEKKANVIEFPRKEVNSTKVLSVWDGIVFDEAITKRLMILSKLNNVSPSMLLYGILSVAVSNLSHSLDPTLSLPSIIIGFPLSIRPFLSNSLSPYNSRDLAIRLAFGGINLPYTPPIIATNGLNAVRNKKLVILCAKLSKKQFEKNLTGRSPRGLGQFLAGQRLNGIERLETELNYGQGPKFHMTIAASMVGDIDRILANSFSFQNQIIKISNLKIGTRLHPKEMLIESFKFNGVIEFTIGYDALRCDTKMVRSVLEEVEKVGKEIVAVVENKRARL